MLSKARISAVVPVTDLARAREFYEGKLGLTPDTVGTDEQPMAIYKNNGAPLMIYERATASSGEHTIAQFDVAADFDTVIDGLLGRGITFDTFDIPGEQDVWDDRGVATFGEFKTAWCKDPDGNVLSITNG